MDTSPPLSKNARKRLLKAERFAASKADRRARDKEKKRARAEKRRADPDALEHAEQARKRRRLDDGPKAVFHARVVVDLAFDALMSDKEVVSLCSQLAYTYSANRRSRTPFSSLLCTSLDGKTEARLDALGAQYKRWQHVHFWRAPYDHLWAVHPDSDANQSATQETVVYLTGDADEELHELKEGETYIIGGICDHNRYKAHKAKAQNIRSARLPIGTYLADLPTRKILTVNQVFDILLHWVKERDWAKALYAVMPKRKFQQGSHSGPNDDQEDAGVDDDPEYDDTDKHVDEQKEEDADPEYDDKDVGVENPDA
ncbi:guanine-1-methyltransferase-domain-containing protein [Gautieria morchelliformis]|nr:guanine-1-methyltransferase-domain-containing protein [Gautieria morchelliformis]